MVILTDFGDDAVGGTVTVTNSTHGGSSRWVDLSGAPLKTFLTEAQAWRRIARRIERGTWRGIRLSTEVERLHSYELVITSRIRDRMTDRLDAHLDAMRERFGPIRLRRPNQLDEKGIAGPRILAAYLLALECEDEAASPSP